jgi:hypothetical protein
VASYRTRVFRPQEGDVPRVIRVELPEGVDSSRMDGSARIQFKDDGRTFFRRYAEDVRAEFRRAMARRRFFEYWQPAMEGR